MPRSRLARLCLSGCLALLAHPALADLTAMQVWQDWRGYMHAMGYHITATEEVNADGLTVRNMTAQAGGPQDDTRVRMDLSEMAFRAQPDGTVVIDMPDILPMTVSGVMGTSRQPYSATLRVLHDKVRLVARGTPEALVYDYKAGSAELVVDSVTHGQRTYAPDALSIVLRADGLKSETTMQPGAMRRYVQSGNFERLSYDITVNLPERTQSVGLTGAITALGFEGAGVLPDIQTADPGAAGIPDGLTAQSTLTLQSSLAELTIEDPETGEMTASLTTGPGQTGFELDDKGVRYTLRHRDITGALLLPKVPYPARITVAELTSDVFLPLPSAEPAGPFSGKLSIRELEASEVIWAVIDPARQLPRSPMAISADISGDPAILAKLSSLPRYRDRGLVREIAEVIEFHELRVETDQASVDISGFLSFDGAGSNMISGLANPVGTLKIRMTGIDDLLQDISNAGILPWGLIAGVRYALGSVAIPGPTPGSSEVVIDMTPDGKFLANGNLLR